MLDIFRVHFKLVYTVSQRSGCYPFYEGFLDGGIIVPFYTILYIFDIVDVLLVF